MRRRTHFVAVASRLGLAFLSRSLVCGELEKSRLRMVRILHTAQLRLFVTAALVDKRFASYRSCAYRAIRELPPSGIAQAVPLCTGPVYRELSTAPKPRGPRIGVNSSLMTAPQHFWRGHHIPAHFPQALSTVWPLDLHPLHRCSSSKPGAVTVCTYPASQNIPRTRPSHDPQTIPTYFFSSLSTVHLSRSWRIIRP